MINEKGSKLLQEVIRNNYSNVVYESIGFKDEEFYYDFKCDEVIAYTLESPPTAPCNSALYCLSDSIYLIGKSL